MLYYKTHNMDTYTIGSILLDLSIGTLLLTAIIRLILVYTYFKRNGTRTLSDDQRKKLRRTIVPCGVVGLLLAIAACITLCL